MQIWQTLCGERENLQTAEAELITTTIIHSVLKNKKFFLKLGLCRLCHIRRTICVARSVVKLIEKINCLLTPSPISPFLDQCATITIESWKMQNSKLSHFDSTNNQHVNFYPLQFKSFTKVLLFDSICLQTQNKKVEMVFFISCLETFNKIFYVCKFHIEKNYKNFVRQHYINYLIF